MAGAFHTRHMAPAVDALRAAAAGVAARRPGCWRCCRTGTAAWCAAGSDWLERIVTQVSAPVRWDLCMQTMAGLGVTALIELPPAGTLTGLARRALPGVQALGPEDARATWTQARALLAGRPRRPRQDSHAPDWRLLVAPLAGTFRAGRRRHARRARHRGRRPAPSSGHVEIRGGDHAISPRVPGHDHRVAGRGRRPGQRRASRWSGCSPMDTD